MVARPAALLSLLLLAPSPASAFVAPALPKTASRATATLFADVTDDAPPSPEAMPEATPEAPVVEAAPKAASATNGSTGDRGLSIVPVNTSSVQFTAGTIGAVAGFALGGPVLAAIFGAMTNYLSRKDGESGALSSAASAVASASQAALQAYNSLAAFEQDKKLVDGALGKFDEAAKDSEGLGSVQKALASVGKVVDDNDLVGGAGTALNSVGDIVETGLDKVVALAEENMS